MSNPASAPCPPAFKSGDGSPSVVVVEILEVRPNSDLEGDDDFVPFYDNHADIYGFVTIDGEMFELPQIEDTDHPHWETIGPRSGVFQKEVSSSPVPIRIDIWEGDSGLTAGDDHVDINGQGGKYHLDFEFDLCSMTVSGDVIASSQGRIESSGGSASDAATIVFRVGLQDARPVTQDDLALVDIDLIQVVPRASRLVARKGTVVMVRLANNHAFDLATDLRIRISGGGSNIDATIPITIEAGEVKKEYLFESNPITFPAAEAAYPIAVTAEIEDPGSGGLDPADCRLTNDRIVNRILWKVVTTNLGFSMLWAKVGTLLDVGNYVPDAHYDELFDLGAPYISAVYPLRDPNQDKSSVEIPPPPVTAGSDWLVSVLSAFQIPLDAVEPIVFLFELNAVAALTGYDRLMGVLPNKDWFTRFSGWTEVTGFSLGEFAPRAVIFLGRNQVGAQMTLPAHELGHTFGLSTDSRLKSNWVCGIDWPIVGHAACGIVGGFDEYKHDDENLRDGNPSSGYWVNTGTVPPALQGIAGQEQCDSHCLMGRSPSDAQLDWTNKGRWIDAADYDRLIDKLSIHPDPELIYVSGMISWNNEIYLGPWYRIGEGIPDHTESRGMYGFRFLDQAGRVRKEVGLPVAWNHAEFHRALPITFFGMTIEFPRDAATVEVWNRGTGTVLATRQVDLSTPRVYLDKPELFGDSTVRLRWTAEDEEGSDLTYAVMVSPSGERWWPSGYGLTVGEFELDTRTMHPGEYGIKVIARNSIRIGESSVETVRVNP